MAMDAFATCRILYAMAGIGADSSILMQLVHGLSKDC